MPNNAVLYPLDFPGTTAGTTSGSSLDEAVTALQIQSRDEAVKDVLSRRIAGQSAIDNQNRLIQAVQQLMPLAQVGKSLLNPNLTALHAFLGGGRAVAGVRRSSLQQLLFSGEVLRPVAAFLSINRLHAGTLSEVAAGRWAGGSAGDHWDTQASIDRFSYRELSSQRVGTQLSIGMRSPAGGIGNKVNGWLLGGETAWEQYRSIHRYTYAAEVSTKIGTLLQTARAATSNGLCNKVNGYLFGGVAFAAIGPAGNYNFFYSIERLVMSTETVTTISHALSYAHAAHAAFGYATKGYLAAGADVANTFSNRLTAFTYASETSATVAATLQESKVGADGAGSNLAGYAIGGDTASSNWTGSVTVDKLTYTNEALNRIATQMAETFANQGAAGDYGSGFSD